MGVVQKEGGVEVREAALATIPGNVVQGVEDLAVHGHAFAMEPDITCVACNRSLI